MHQDGDWASQKTKGDASRAKKAEENQGSSSTQICPCEKGETGGRSVKLGQVPKVGFLLGRRKIA